MRENKSHARSQMPSAISLLNSIAFSPPSISLTFLSAPKINPVFLTLFCYAEVVNHHEHIFLSDCPLVLPPIISSTYNSEHSPRLRPQLSPLFYIYKYLNKSVS